MPESVSVDDIDMLPIVVIISVVGFAVLDSVLVVTWVDAVSVAVTESISFDPQTKLHPLPPSEQQDRGAQDARHTTRWRHISMA